MVKTGAVVFGIVVLAGCATSWQDNGVFYKSVQTDLRIESMPQSQVYVNGVYKRDTPATVPLVYEREVKKKTRKVSYWITQPGWAFLLTIASLGFYLPFSPIPVDIETSLEPTGDFKGNRFDVRATVSGYQDWDETIQPQGEKDLSRNVVLEKEAGIVGEK
jgi:hypothetical protein